MVDSIDGVLQQAATRTKVYWLMLITSTQL